MDFPNQTQLVHRHPRQPLVLEVDMHDASQRDPIVHKALHASVGQECLAGAAHALDNRRGPQFLGIFHISRHDPIGNPVVVELAHDRHQFFSHRNFSFSFVWRALYHTPPTFGKCDLPIFQPSGRITQPMCSTALAERRPPCPPLSPVSREYALGF